MFPFRFGGKKEVKKVYIPVDLVLNYSSQGLSEPDIISRLETQGFAPEHIDKALRIALREKVMSGAPPMAGPEIPAPEPPAPMPFEMAPTPMGEISRHPMPLGYPPERIMNAEPRRFQETLPPEEPERFEEKPTEITVEEIIEAIVEERWKEFEEKLNHFDKKDMQLQSEIGDLRKEMDRVGRLLEEKEKTVVTKLEDFGGSMENIEGRIGSIERVFKDFLPELTQNIRAMSDLVGKIKEEEKQSH